MLHSFGVLSYPSQHLTSSYWTCVTTTAGCCNVLQSNPELVKGKVTGFTMFRQKQTYLVQGLSFVRSAYFEQVLSFVRNSLLCTTIAVRQVQLTSCRDTGTTVSSETAYFV